MQKKTHNQISRTLKMKANKKVSISKKTPLNEICSLAPACKCSACSHGCTMGSGFLAEGDSKRIAEFLNITEEQLKEQWLEEVDAFNKKHLRPKILRKSKPYGRCIFYDSEKGCTVHPVKPLQCKISMGCKPYSEDLHAWFVLNYLIDSNDAESLRQYKIYLETGGAAIPGGSVEELVPDKETRERILNYEVL